MVERKLKVTPAEFEIIRIEEESEEEIAEKSFEKQTKELITSLSQQIRVGQIFSIIISLAIVLVFNFITYWSELFSHLLTTGELFLDEQQFLSFIINLIFLVVLIFIIMYLPRISMESKGNLVVYTIFGILLGLGYSFLINFFEITLIFENNDSSIFILAIFLPLLIAQTIIIKEKDKHYFKLSLLITSLILTLIIADSSNSIAFQHFYQNDPILFILIIIFSIIMITYLYLGSKFDYRKTEMRVMQLD